MTIRLLDAHGPYPVNAIVTLDAGTEAGLVAAKEATTDLTGGLAYVAPSAPSQRYPAQIEVDASGNVTGLVGPDGEQVFDIFDAGFSSRKTACALGDSITADAYTGGKWTNWGWLAWTRRFLADRIDLPGSRMYAIGGKTAAQVRSEQLPQALVNKTDIAFVHCGTNSLGSVTTEALIADIKAIYDALRANGTFVVAIPIRQHSGVSTLSGTALLQLCAVNRFIAEYSRTRTGIMMVDVNPSFIDFSTGNVKAGLLRDGLHDNVESAKLMGKLVADALSPLLPAYDDRMMHVGDVYDAANNVRGNILTNGLLAGTGGTVINGATGTTPAGWRGYRSANAGTVTAAFSKEAHATYAGLEKAVITIGGTASGQIVLFDQEVSSTPSIAEGDIVQAECEIEYAFTEGAFYGISLKTGFKNGSNALLSDAWDGYYTATNGAYPSDSGSFILRTDPLVVPAGHASRFVNLTIGLGSSGALNGVVKVGRVSLRKIVD